MNIGIQLVPVFSDRKLLIIIYWYVDFLRADGLFVRVVELCDVGVLEAFLCCQTLIRIEVEQILQKI